MATRRTVLAMRCGIYTISFSDGSPTLAHAIQLGNQPAIREALRASGRARARAGACSALTEVQRSGLPSSCSASLVDLACLHRPLSPRKYSRDSVEHGGRLVRNKKWLPRFLGSIGQELAMELAQAGKLNPDLRVRTCPV